MVEIAKDEQRATHSESVVTRRFALRRAPRCGRRPPIARNLVLLAAAALLSGCGATSFHDARGWRGAENARFELGAAGPLAPARAPRRQDWSTFDIIHLGSGERDRVRIEPYGSSGVRGRFSDGCVWTRQADWFSPSDSWAFCGDSDDWRTAQAAVQRTGSLWPLKIGASARYVREARSSTSGEISRRTTTCTVLDAVDVRRSSGQTEAAFKVRCEDGRRARTTWWSPSSGLLFYRQEHRSRGVERFWERVSD